MHKRTLHLLVVVLAAVLFMGEHALAIPTFFVDSTPPPSLTNDLGWQAAVGMFSEIDFTSFADGETVSSFTVGGVTVTPTLPNVGGGASPLAFAGQFAAAGGQYGTVFDRTLYTCSTSDCFIRDTRDHEITFTFSEPVFGFGAWISDDLLFQPDSFAMRANGATSGVVDANPGENPWIIDGFLGVVDPEGISSLTIFNTGPSSLTFRLFEVDHIQVSTNFPSEVPAPATTWLLVMGLSVLGAARARRRS